MKQTPLADGFPAENEDLASRLATNLLLTPEERLIQHQSALDLVQQLQMAMSDSDEKSQQTFTETPGK